MTEAEFLRIYRFIKSRYGIDMERKKEIMQGRLENYLRIHGFQDYSEYMNAVEMDFTGKMERDLVNILTTNHTFFMREFEHFDYLRQVVLPELKKTEDRKKGFVYLVWCSIHGAGALHACHVDERLLWVGAWNVGYQSFGNGYFHRGFGTGSCRKIYQKQIECLPEHWKRRFLRTTNGGEQYEMTAEIKNEVIFRQFNLMDVFPFRRKMHIVFLRNVMIYFDKETKDKLI